MKWDMEIEEVEAVLEKIWDLHDKLSDAIHSVSRAHFLNSIKAPTKPEKKKHQQHPSDGFVDETRTGFVFVKDYKGGGIVNDDDHDLLAVAEAKSLNAIRTALENLEDQLEFFHTVQIQQRAERDAAIARLEQSRIILALRLAEFHGKKYKVIEEALAFVGDVHDAGRFVSPENLYQPASPFGENFVSRGGKRSNILIRLLLSSFSFVKNSLKMDPMGGIIGNAALLAISMLALMHVQKVGYKNKFVIEHPVQQDGYTYGSRNMKKASLLESSSNGHSNQLDVLMARG